MRQVSFSFMKDYKKEFGGSLLVGKRKSQRPLSTKLPIHLVLRASQKTLFKPHNSSLERLIRSQAKAFNIKIYELALNWSHIHLLIKLQERDDYVKFIRSLTSILVQRIKEYFPEIKTVFSLRPYTRIVSWGKDFRNAFNYQILNQLEAWGVVRRRKKAKKRLSSLGRDGKREEGKALSMLNSDQTPALQVFRNFKPSG